MTIRGTSFSVMEATRFRPPRITAPTATSRKMPVAMVGMPKAVWTLETMEFTWLMLPMPKEASRQKKENRAASTAPMVLQPFFAPRPSRR